MAVIGQANDWWKIQDDDLAEAWIASWLTVGDCPNAVVVQTTALSMPTAIPAATLVPTAVPQVPSPQEFVALVPSDQQPPPQPPAGSQPMSCPAGTSAINDTQCRGDANGGSITWAAPWSIFCDGHSTGDAAICWHYTLTNDGGGNDQFTRQAPIEPTPTELPPAQLACPVFGDGGLSSPQPDGRSCVHPWDGLTYTGNVPDGWTISCDNPQNPDGTYLCGSWTLWVQ